MTRSKGFTLLELLVVIVIIGLLAGYVAPRYFAQVGKSEVPVARAQQIESLEKALDQYRLDALVAKPANEAGWSGPNLKNAVAGQPGQQVSLR
jgi:general secretion pathway protein G